MHCCVHWKLIIIIKNNNSENFLCLSFLILKIIHRTQISKDFLPPNTFNIYYQRTMCLASYQVLTGMREGHTALYSVPMEITSIGWNWWYLTVSNPQNCNFMIQPNSWGDKTNTPKTKDILEFIDCWIDSANFWFWQNLFCDFGSHLTFLIKDSLPWNLIFTIPEKLTLYPLRKDNKWVHKLLIKQFLL